MNYSRGPYNRMDANEQWIRLSEGCPNNCPFCYETPNCGTEPIYFGIPQIERNIVKIMDMNLIYKPRAVEIINCLGQQRVNGKVVNYELICGIDYRYMTQEKANALKAARFQNIRLAWDHGLEQQYKVTDAIKMLLKAGYESRMITVFMICNWQVPYADNCRKLDLCKVWKVKAADCWYDNQLSPNIKPIHWHPIHIKEFRRMVRLHNQLVMRGIYPEIKPPLQKLMIIQRKAHEG